MEEAGETFIDFYTRVWPKTVGLAALLVGDRDAAADVAQDSLEAVRRHWTRVDHPDAYLRVVVRRNCIQATNGRYRFAPLAEAESIAANTEDFDAVEQGALIQALRRLRRPSLEVVVLRFYCDLAEADIAETLGCRLGTVKSRLHRALRQLGKDIKP